MWCTTQLAKLSLNHSNGRTHSWRFSTLYIKKGLKNVSCEYNRLQRAQVAWFRDDICLFSVVHELRHRAVMPEPPSLRNMLTPAVQLSVVFFSSPCKSTFIKLRIQVQGHEELNSRTRVFCISENVHRTSGYPCARVKPAWCFEGSGITGKHGSRWSNSYFWGDFAKRKAYLYISEKANPSEIVRLLWTSGLGTVNCSDVSTTGCVVVIPCAALCGCWGPRENLLSGSTEDGRTWPFAVSSFSADVCPVLLPED